MFRRFRIPPTPIERRTTITRNRTNRLDRRIGPDESFGQEGTTVKAPRREPFVSILPVAALLAASAAMAMMLFSNLSFGDERAPSSRPARKNVKLPGLVINFQERCVDVDSAVCLDSGYLELIACTKGTKEHESIVAIKARAVHIHAGLLLLGANRGNPAMQKPIDKKKTRWVHLPPKGDPVDVSLVFKNKKGKLVERPVSDFVTRSDNNLDEVVGVDGAAAEKNVKFPNTFLFAGSLLGGNGSGPRKYMSDLSGNVISIATFGDELLCLPGTHAQQNGSLMWQIDATELPKVGTKVTLRLRPKRQGAPTTRPGPKK